LKIKDIMERCSKLDISEQRSMSDDYSELVFFNKELEEWDKAFKEMFGPAKKPAGTEPSEEDQAITEEYGGIFENQTLFKKDLDDSVMIAMFWPWQDGVHTTLKIASIKK
jgi:hypothetical protein